MLQQKKNDERRKTLPYFERSVPKKIIIYQLRHFFEHSATETLFVFGTS